MDHRLAGREAEARRLAGCGRSHRAIQHARARDPPGPAHLLGEGHQPVGAAMRGWRGHETAAAGLAADQPVLGETLHRVAGRHAATPNSATRSVSDGNLAPGRSVAIRSRSTCSIWRYWGW